MQIHENVLNVQLAVKNISTREVQSLSRFWYRRN